MKIVVIGSKGFVGQQLCNRLKELGMAYIGVDLGFDNRAQDFIACDITKPDELEKIPLTADDIVVHLATRQYANKPPRQNRQAFFDDVNVMGLENVLKAMQQKGVQRLVYFSSDMVYGLPQSIPLDASHPKQPIGEYGKSKLKAEQLCESYQKKGFSISIFRPRLILGPGRLGVLAKLFRLIENNRPVPLIGNGNNYYQMVSVFDCVSAIEQAIKFNCPNKTFNLGSEELISIKELLTDLIVKNGSKSKLIRSNAKLSQTALKILGFMGFELLYPEQYLLADKMYSVDIETTKQELDWKPKHNDKQMLNQAYQWYKENEI